MQANETIKLAAQIAAHGRSMAFENTHLAELALTRYWSASRIRIDRWTRSVAALRNPRGALEGQGAKRRRVGAASLLHELFTTESLTRVWTAVVALHEQGRGQAEFEPVCRSIFASHRAISHRALQTLLELDATTLSTSSATTSVTWGQDGAELARVRHRVERWTDLLVGSLAARHDVAQYAFDPDRALDFAEDIQRQARSAGGHQARTLTNHALRKAFRESRFGPSPNADLNGKIADGILSCLDAVSFDAVGPLHARRLARLLDRTCDIETLVSGLLEIGRSSVRSCGR